MQHVSHEYKVYVYSTCVYHHREICSKASCEALLSHQNYNCQGVWQVCTQASSIWALEHQIKDMQMLLTGEISFISISNIRTHSV